MNVIRYALNRHNENRPLVLSEEDASKVKSSGKWSAIVLDQSTGKKIRLVSASCGLPRCHCAMRIQPIE